MAVLALARSEGLRDERIQSHEQAATEESQHDKMLEPRLTAPMAVALLGRRPTIIVSTMAMLIQPSSASTRGMARLSVGRNSARSVWSPSMGGGVREKSLSGAREKEQT